LALGAKAVCFELLDSFLPLCKYFVVYVNMESVMVVLGPNILLSGLSGLSGLAMMAVSRFSVILG
jgi:hypothetical protein